MSVLIEANSVVIKKDAIEKKFPGGLAEFMANPPNQTVCDDGKLIRVGFMAGRDAQDYVDQLEACGLVCLQGDHAVDIAAVDQIRGLLVNCNWIRIVQIQHDGGEIGAIVKSRVLEELKKSGVSC